MPPHPANCHVIAVDWDSPEAEAVRTIRMAVFVDEQQVPADLEIDDIDPTAFHVLAVDIRGNPVATGRMFPDPDRPGAARIGRMAVVAPERGKGYGDAVLVSLMKAAAAKGFQRAVLHSQTHATGFYARHGFHASGSEFFDAGIPHYEMDCDLTSIR